MYCTHWQINDDDDDDDKFCYLDDMLSVEGDVDVHVAVEAKIRK